MSAESLRVTDESLQKSLLKNIKELLSSKREGVKPLSVVSAIIFFLIVLPFISWGIWEDTSSNSFTGMQLFSHYCLLVVGVALGILLWDYISIFVAKLCKHKKQINDQLVKFNSTQVTTRWLIAVILCVISFVTLYFEQSVEQLVPIIVGVASGTLFSGALILVMSFISTRKKGSLARLGIILFIVSKIVELHYYK